MANSKLMQEGRLDADEFLNRILYQQSSDDFGMLDVTLVNISIDSDTEEEIDDAEFESQSPASPSPSSTSTLSSESSSSGSSVGQCASCEAEPELLLLPCFEFCVCKKCWNILEKNVDKPKCPSCNTIVTQAKEIRFHQQ